MPGKASAIAWLTILLISLLSDPAAPEVVTCIKFYQFGGIYSRGAFKTACQTPENNFLCDGKECTFNNGTKQPVAIKGEALSDGSFEDVIQLKFNGCQAFNKPGGSSTAKVFSYNRANTTSTTFDVQGDDGSGFFGSLNCTPSAPLNSLATCGNCVKQK